jgi:hypothetical protein
LGYRSFGKSVFWCRWRAQSFKSVTKFKKRKEIIYGHRELVNRGRINFEL